METPRRFHFRHNPSPGRRPSILLPNSSGRRGKFTRAVIKRAPTTWSRKTSKGTPNGLFLFHTGSENRSIGSQRHKKNEHEPTQSSSPSLVPQNHRGLQEAIKASSSSGLSQSTIKKCRSLAGADHLRLPHSIGRSTRRKRTGSENMSDNPRDREAKRNDPPKTPLPFPGSRSDRLPLPVLPEIVGCGVLYRANISQWDQKALHGIFAR